MGSPTKEQRYESSGKRPGVSVGTRISVEDAAAAARVIKARGLSMSAWLNGLVVAELKREAGAKPKSAKQGRRQKPAQP